VGAAPQHYLVCVRLGRTRPNSREFHRLSEQRDLTMVVEAKIY
jgi:hypothetical protein